MNAVFGFITKNGQPADPEILQKMASAVKEVNTNVQFFLEGSAAIACANYTARNNHLKGSYLSDRFLITVNGYLHNRAELITKLRLDLIDVTEMPDAALIQKAYERWGNDCARHMDGEYIFLVYDRIQQELLI